MLKMKKDDKLIRPKCENGLEIHEIS